MTFEEILDAVLAMLQRRGRMTYRTLKRQFHLDDDAFEDLKDELLYAHPHVVADDGRGLVWTGEARPTPTPGSPPATDQARIPLAYTPPYLAEKILTSKRVLEGERKQVTVLFADLKGSMELLADRDPEEARQLLDPVLERMMAAVHRYEGTVNQVMGDGIMALFGAPIAHEDHAIRACYAALAMQAALRRYSDAVQRTQGLAVHFRVGLNSGEVVVRGITNDLHLDYSAIGQTVHLAARMEELATPGSILLTPATLRLVEDLVQVHALGPMPVKGLVEPVEVAELVGVSMLRRRLQAAVGRGLTRFVGRQQELAALAQALEHAGAGHGQVVAVVGEAGVGKSRLVYECVHSHHTPGWLVLESASVSYGKAMPYFPVIDLLKRYAHVEEHDDLCTIRAKVTGQVVTLDAALQDTGPALLSLLDALPDDSPFLQLDPPQRRQRTLSALKRVLLCESQVQPVLLVFEDLHWIDSETQALLDSLVESLPTARLLLLVNYRPEHQHGWGSKTYYTQLRLEPLPPASADELLQVLLGHDPSLASLTGLLIARTEGNPFFLEESVRTLVETGVLVGAPGAYRLAKPLDSLQVPVTVQAVLAARIDRLPPEEKRLLQTAAVIGTEVPLPLLQAVAGVPEAALHRSLTHLQATEFLYETRRFPEPEYTFTHALTHEVAYNSLLLERRRVLHARLVEALEALTPEQMAEQVERLAHHALRGEVWDKAVRYCRQAGEKAVTRSAYRVAVAAFEQALGALQHLPESRVLCERAIDLRLALDFALWRLGDWVRVLASLREAEALAERLGDQRRLAQVSSEMADGFRILGDYERALMAGQRACTLAIALEDEALQIEANTQMGVIYYYRGDYGRAIEALRQTVTALARHSHRKRDDRPDAWVWPWSWLLVCLSQVGAFAEGHALSAEVLRLAETAEHPFCLAVASYGVGLLSRRQGDLPKAIAVLERGLAVCHSCDLRDWVPTLAAGVGYAYALAGRLPEALTLLEQAVDQHAAMRGGTPSSTAVVWWGEAYLLAGQLDEAYTQAQRGLEISRAHQERGNQAYALRLLGDIAAQREPPEHEQAGAYYQQALALAEELGMRPLQAHCYRGLGTLYTKTGQAEQARAALAAAIALYRDMDMTFWLPQTEAALAQVEGRP
jgi:class 3 adenylate cyclase/tetratricopeptide (TPR) repeat protein